MKFVCLKCEEYMDFHKVEAPEEGRLGITFGCKVCGSRFSMVTNPGETQLVSSLGVSLGGKTAPYAPLEMTRGTLKNDPTLKSSSMAAYMSMRTGGQAGTKTVEAGASTEGASAAPGGDPLAGCPFSSMVREMGLGGAAPARDAGTAGTEAATAPAPSEARWTVAAQEQMDRLPTYVRQVLKKTIEEYAGKHGFATITPEVMGASKQNKGGIDWSTEATERLNNIPDFVRPMARREIERLARESGAPTITAEVMDQAKHAFSM